MKTLFKILTLCILFATEITYGGNEISKNVKSFSDDKFVSYNLFNTYPLDNNEIKKEVSSYKIFSIDRFYLKQVIQDQPKFIKIDIGEVKLVLYKSDILADGFEISTSEQETYTGIPMVHYRGIIENDYNSLASISISEKEVCGFYSDVNSNFVVGKLLNSDLHIVYDEKDLVGIPKFNCQTIPINNVKKNIQTQSSVAGKCISFYLEVDYDIYTGRGNDINNVNTFIQGAFAQVATLYANDGMTIKTSQIFIWTTPDPYNGPDTYSYLVQFGNYRTSFNGDLAHLIGYQGGGGIAYLNTLCYPTVYRTAYSDVNSTFNIVPTYSWTVNVLAHEMGHNVASPHTHDCAWNGNNTAIDGCGPAAGYTTSCPVAPLPSNGGTLMSYCHLLGGVGVNFNNGFGTQPSTLMRNAISSASCLTTCDTTNPPPPPPGCTRAPSTPGIISGPSSVCRFQQNVSYSIQAVPTATSYRWTVPSGCSIVINGINYGTTVQTTNTSIKVNFGNKRGKIQVRAINSCGTSSARSFSFTFNCRYGLDMNEKNIWVYPNPASSEISVSITCESEENYITSIFDDLGKMVFEKNDYYNEGENTKTIDINSLSRGIYTIKISNSRQNYIKKFIIIK